MRNPIDTILRALNCAEADLQGVIERHILRRPPDAVDIDAAQQTILDIVLARQVLQLEVTSKAGVLSMLKRIQAVADSESNAEHPDPLGDAADMLDNYIIYLEFDSCRT